MSSFAQGFAMGGDLASQAQKIQLAEEAAAREKERFTWEQKNRAGEESLRTAALNVANMGDTMQTVVSGSEGSKDMPEGQMGPYAESQTVPMSAEQKEALFKKEALAGGANPLNVMAYQKGALDLEMGAMGVKKGKIELKDIEKQQQFKDWMMESTDLIAKDPVAWAKQNINLYNKPGKNSILNDGMTGEIVPGPNGSAAFVQTDKKGKITSSTPITTESAQAIFDKVAFAKYSALDFKGGKELGFKDREVGIKQQEVDIHKGFYGPGGVYERVGMAKVAASGARSGGGGSNSPENQDRALTNQAETLVKGQPNRFKNIDEARAWIVNSKYKGADAEKQWQTIETDLYKQGREAEIGNLKNKFFADRGFAPQSVMNIAASGINPDTKKPFTEAEQNEFARRYPNSYVEFGTPNTNSVPEPKTAIPPVEKAKTEVKTTITPKEANPAEVKKYKENKEAKEKEVAKEKETKQAIKVEKENKVKERAVEAQKIQNQRETEATKRQLSILEARREKALKKDPNADVTITDRAIKDLKKRLQD